MNYTKRYEVKRSKKNFLSVLNWCTKNDTC